MYSVFTYLQNIQSLPLIKSSYKCEQDIDSRSRLMTNSSCFESHIHINCVAISVIIVSLGHLSFGLDLLLYFSLKPKRYLNTKFNSKLMPRLNSVYIRILNSALITNNFYP